MHWLVSLWDTEEENSETQGKGHVKTEAEMAVMLPQAKQRLEPAEPERGKGGLSPRALGESVAQLMPWFQTFGLQICKNQFIFFKQPSLW